MEFPPPCLPPAWTPPWKPFPRLEQQARRTVSNINLIQQISTCKMDRDSSFAPSTASYESTSVSGPASSSRLSTDPSQASSATIRGNPMKQAVRTQKAPPPLPFYSQAIICQGMVYCSGSIGVSPVTKKLVEGGVGDRTVGGFHPTLSQPSLIYARQGPSAQQLVRCSRGGQLIAEIRRQMQCLPI